MSKFLRARPLRRGIKKDALEERPASTSEHDRPSQARDRAFNELKAALVHREQELLSELAEFELVPGLDSVVRVNLMREVKVELNAVRRRLFELSGGVVEKSNDAFDLLARGKTTNDRDPLTGEELHGSFSVDVETERLSKEEAQELRSSALGVEVRKDDIDIDLWPNLFGLQFSGRKR